MTDASLIIDTAKVGETWCVFEHQAQLTQGAPPETIMVGVCKLIDVFKLRDSRVNTEWNAIFKHGGQVMVRIIATGTDRATVQRQATAHMRTFNPMPRCNLRGFNLRGASRPIECVTNRKIYDSQKDAAEDLNIHQSALSRHLKGDSAHVGGYVFRYVTGVGQ